MKFEQNVLNKLDKIISLLSEEEIISIELEDHNFKINSDGWEKITVDGVAYLQNKEKDIWEFLEGECKGEQLFTYDAAMRETKKEGKLIPSDEQIEELLNTKEDLKNITYPGFRNTDNKFYTLSSYLVLWSSTPSGPSNAWRRYLLSSYSTVYRHANPRAYGFSVRCLKS